MGDRWLIGKEIRNEDAWIFALRKGKGRGELLGRRDDG